MPPSGSGSGSDGFLTITYLLAVGLTLVLLTQICNVLVHAYGRGAVRAALDEGVRAAALADGEPDECAARATAVLADLLGGTMGAGVGPVWCGVEDERVRASVDVRFPSWLPGVPAHAFTASAQVVREPPP